jgi:hypothetical protein
MESIKLQTVLAEIDQSVRDDRPFYFSIVFAKKDGTISEKLKVRKSGSHPGQVERKTDRTSYHYNVKRKGVIKLYDEFEKQHFDAKICLLMYFNGIRIWH